VDVWNQESVIDASGCCSNSVNNVLGVFFTKVVSVKGIIPPHFSSPTFSSLRTEKTHKRVDILLRS
jgi:hypothetical protein